MTSALAAVLDGLSKRDKFTGDNDFVFPGEAGAPLDGSALRRRYAATQKKAELPTLRFHDLRHTFGTSAALSGPELQAWMGHADYRTTQRYLHYR